MGFLKRFFHRLANPKFKSKERSPFSGYSASIPSKPRVSGSEPLSTGGSNDVVYDSVRKEEKARFKALTELLELPEQHRKELSELMCDPPEHMLSGERAYTTWVKSILFSCGVKSPELDKWVQRFKEEDYVPYMWRGAPLVHNESVVVEPLLASLRERLSGLPVAARAVLVGAGALENKVVYQVDKASKKCGMTPAEIRGVLGLLRDQGLAAAPSTGGLVKSACTKKEIQDVLREEGLKISGRKDEVARRLVKGIEEERLKSLLPEAFAADNRENTFSCGPVEGKLETATLKVERQRIEVMLHYAQMICNTQRDVRKAKQSDVVKGLRIALVDEGNPIAVEEAKKAERLPPFFPGCRAYVTSETVDVSAGESGKGKLQIYPPS